MKKLLICCILSQLFALSAFAFPVTRHVPVTYSTVQSAINAAAHGDTVLVSPGIYTGSGNRDIDFHGKDVTVRSLDPNDPNIVAATIIDCNGSEADQHRGFYFHNGEDQNSILDGLTITNGYANPGGAIFCENSSPLISNCVFTNNFADWVGGAICNWESSTPPKIQNCSFIENSANAQGGAIYNYNSTHTIIAGCTFTANTALNFQPDPNKSTGGAIYCSYNGKNEPGTLTLTDSTFTANESYKAGAVLLGKINASITGCSFIDNSSLLNAGAVKSGGLLEITDCIFKRNTSAASGTALYTSQAVIKNCVFTDNSSAGSTGALYISRGAFLTNCLFTGNSGARVGTLSYDSTIYPVDFIICTFKGNRATGSETYTAEAGAILNEGSQAAITNCILWNNSPNEIALDDPNEEPSITYSNIKDGYAGLGNISADPCFIALGWWDVNEPNDPNDDFWIEGDYHLESDSPCIDAGDPNYVLDPNFPTDLDGRPRIADGDCDANSIVDMGAYEFNWAYAGDFAGGCDVDLQDFEIFQRAFLTTPADGSYNPACDIALPVNGQIDWYDLNTFTTYWLQSAN